MEQRTVFALETQAQVDSHAIRCGGSMQAVTERAVRMLLSVCRKCNGQCIAQIAQGGGAEADRHRLHGHVEHRTGYATRPVRPRRAPERSASRVCAREDSYRPDPWDCPLPTAYSCRGERAACPWR